jgi:TatD DNase family protein
MFVDSHVNLHGEQFKDDLDDVVERAHAADVQTMLTICCKFSEFEPVLAVAEKYNNMYASVGTHPHEARENPDIKPADLIAKSKHEKIIGIGETGLDFHYNYSDRDDQYANFRAHIEAARETQLPLIIHSRNADQEMVDILEQEMAKGTFPALLHCYTGGHELAERAVDMGLYFSMSGIISFKNAKDLRDIAKNLPDDRILIETDCPYLAPVPHRGQRNEPAFVVDVARALADVKEWSIEETAQRTTDAFFALFSKAERPVTP